MINILVLINVQINLIVLKNVSCLGVRYASIYKKEKNNWNWKLLKYGMNGYFLIMLPTFISFFCLSSFSLLFCPRRQNRLLMIAAWEMFSMFQSEIGR